jgi:putative ABC transport system permease protein
MDWMHILARRLRARLRPLFARRETEAELDEELRFHLDAEIRERMRRGMTADAARTSALRDFGGVARYKEEVRDAWGTRVADEITRDARYGLRALRRAPAFTAISVLTVALGVGAATAIFSVVQSVLRPLPYDAPASLMAVVTLVRGADDATSALDFVDFRRQSKTFAGLAAISGDAMTITGGGDPERLNAAAVSANLLDVLRVRPLIGRGFQLGEDSIGAPRAVLLSEAVWRRRYSADSAVIGRAAILDGNPYTIVGVVGGASVYPARTDVFVPLVFPADDLDEGNRGARYYDVIGRLANGVTPAQANAEMRTIGARLAAEHPDADRAIAVRVEPLLGLMIGAFQRPLLILMGAAGVLLLIACANVANLLLVRAAARDGELAVRTALGAARARLVRQLATEAMVPFIAGGALGVVLSTLGVRAFVTVAGTTIPRLADAGVNGSALTFALAATLVTGVVFGVLPALRFARLNVSGTLRSVGRTNLGSAERRRARTAIVGSEVALAVVLLVVAGLVIRSFRELMAVDPGFRRDGVVTFRLDLPAERYDKPEKLRAFASALDERVRGMPGVTGSGRVLRAPLSEYNFNVGFTVDGRADPGAGSKPAVQVRIASPGYFEAMGIRLVGGRTFSNRDDATAPQVVVINRAMARVHFPGEQPIGKRLWLSWSEDGVRRGGQVVGVIDDIHQFGLERAPEPELYLPYDQTPVRQMTVVARTATSPDVVFAAARAAVRELDADLPLFELTTLDRRIQSSAARPRLYMALLMAFAIVAVVLAAIGLYGVVSYAVRQQSHELGVRIALGASRRDVVGLVIGSSLRVTIIGAASGIAVALGASRLLQALLFGISATDPWTYAAVVALILAVGALASWIPALRATAIDPCTALRSE